MGTPLVRTAGRAPGGTRRQSPRRNEERQAAERRRSMEAQSSDRSGSDEGRVCRGCGGAESLDRRERRRRSKQAAGQDCMYCNCNTKPQEDKVKDERVDILSARTRPVPELRVRAAPAAAASGSGTELDARQAASLPPAWPCRTSCVSLLPSSWRCLHAAGDFRYLPGEFVDRNYFITEE